MLNKKTIKIQAPLGYEFDFLLLTKHCIVSERTDCYTIALENRRPVKTTRWKTEWLALFRGCLIAGVFMHA